MDDPFAALHQWIIKLLSEPRSRAELESVFRQVWDEQQFAEDFEFLGFIDEAVEGRFVKAWIEPTQLHGIEAGN